MQTITEVTGERVSRAVRKRILREGSKIQQDTVNVVKLRREYQKDDSKESKSVASYQHRFIVSGHWRNQFYPSIKTNRQIWIDSYIKGDPEKELIFKKRVFDFSK
mgnify:CR=1 FL=1